jgi:hypothetical protein
VEDRAVHGACLNFGNLTYAPINEQGVVFLFGMVSRALGFESVERVGPDFPDCVAMRRINSRGEQQRVKIECEYRSREFNHDPERCDVIVCWEDNWGKQSPIEVIELKTEIEKLRHLDAFK